MMVIKLVIVVVVAAVAPSVGVTSGTRWSRQAGRRAEIGAGQASAQFVII